MAGAGPYAFQHQGKSLVTGKSHLMGLWGLELAGEVPGAVSSVAEARVGAVKVPARAMRARARYFIGVLSADYLYLLGNSMG